MARARKRGRPKKKQKKISSELIGVILLLVNFLAIGQFGFVGRFFANLGRFFVGETYIVVSIAVIGIGSYLIIKGKSPNFKNPRWLGGVLLFCAAVVWQHAQLFAPIMETDVNIIQATWRLITPQFTTNTIGQSVGGGMIGAVLYAVSYFLFSAIGTYLMMGVFIFVGIMTFFQFSYKALLDKLRTAGRNAVNFVKGKAAAIKENRKNRKPKQKKPANKKNQKKRKWAEQLTQSDQETPLPEPDQESQLAPASQQEEELDTASSGQMALKIEGFQQNNQSKTEPAEQETEEEEAS